MKLDEEKEKEKELQKQQKQKIEDMNYAGNMFSLTRAEMDGHRIGDICDKW